MDILPKLKKGYDVIWYDENIDPPVYTVSSIQCANYTEVFLKPGTNKIDIKRIVGIYDPNFARGDLVHCCPNLDLEKRIFYDVSDVLEGRVSIISSTNDSITVLEPESTWEVSLTLKAGCVLGRPIVSFKKITHQRLLR